MSITIHIGLHKTGTTAIQYVMAKNADLLRDRGVLYPSSGRQGAGHHRLAWSLWRDPSLLPLWDDLRTEIEGENRVVLSSEDFEFLQTSDRWQTLCDLLDTTPDVVCFLRPQADYLLSSYLQHVESGHTYSFDEHLPKMKRRLDYESHLESIATVVGVDRLAVRVYDRKTLIGDFLSLLDVDPEGLMMPKVANPSLSEAGFNIMLDVNKVVADAETRRTIADSVLRHASGDKPNLLPGERRQEITEWFRDGNRNVARRFLGRSELF